MHSNTPLDDANNFVIQRLIRRYLSPNDQRICTIEGACVTVQKIGNRSGVPRDAVTYFYTIEHPELGFYFDARSVWRCGGLMEPVAVHTTILDYDDLQERHGSDYAVRLIVNDWLQAVPL